MTAREIIDALTNILAEILVLNPSDIKPSRKLVDDLDADSIAFLELTYRLRRDLGLTVPDAKVDEETLRLPLLEGLQRLEQAIGGTTLFEFMKVEALHEDHSDPELRARSVEILRERLQESAFAETLKRAAATGDDDTARAAALLLHQLHRTPELVETIDALGSRDETLAQCMRALDRIADAEIAEHGWPEGARLAALWRDAVGMDRAAAELGALKIKQLAYLMGTNIPDGKEPDAPIAALELRDMFRFITVEGYVRYVLHLAAAQRPDDMDDADTIAAEVAAWLRA
jgi:acyl carrier protein